MPAPLPHAVIPRVLRCTNTHTHVFDRDRERERERGIDTEADNRGGWGIGGRERERGKEREADQQGLWLLGRWWSEWSCWATGRVLPLQRQARPARQAGAPLRLGGRGVGQGTGRVCVCLVGWVGIELVEGDDASYPAAPTSDTSPQAPPTPPPPPPSPLVPPPLAPLAPPAPLGPHTRPRGAQQVQHKEEEEDEQEARCKSRR